MPQDDSTSLSTIADSVSGLPLPIKVSFLKAMSDLLGGLMAIPAAKLRQYAQSIEDTTTGRSTAASTLAKAAASAAVSDPVIAQAAAEIYLPTAIRKTKNRIQVAQFASEHVSEDLGNSGESSPPDDDWMNAFMRFAEDASSSRLQDLFGRILAGQVKRPGAFALSTLRAVSELDSEIANDFSIVWGKSVGEAVDYSQDFQRGEGFARWKRLAEAGLMAPTEIAQFLPQFRPVADGNALWMPAFAGLSTLLIQFPRTCSASWQNIPFSRAGREIGTLLAPPDYERNLRAVGQKLSATGVARVELHTQGLPVEVIFPNQSGVGATFD